MQLRSVMNTTQSVAGDWLEFATAYKESCAVLDGREYLLEAVPTLYSAETLKVCQ